MYLQEISALAHTYSLLWYWNRFVWIFLNFWHVQVPFTDVLELVRGLKVYVCQGFAFVPQPEFVVIVLNVFRSKLSHALVVSRPTYYLHGRKTCADAERRRLIDI